jgi:carbamoyltransferase
MDILGVNAFHADAAAAILRGGAFVAGVEEERLNRIKHWAGFPAGAIAAVLDSAGATLAEVAHVGVSRDPRAHLLRKALFVLRRRPDLAAVRSRLANHRRVEGVGDRLQALDPLFRGTVHHVEHHRAHLASAFFCSPFEVAACLTVDGFGDFLSSMSAVGRGGRLEVLDEVPFPHSLGILYTAVTQFLGFRSYGDEYKVMALASFGEPRFLPRLREIVRLRRDGRFETDVAYFRHATEGVTMTWDGGAPALGPLWSPRFEEAFGPPRAPGDDLGGRHHDLAASLQAVFEEALYHRLRSLHRRTGATALCLAGGCALNAVANGRIPEATPFHDVFIQPAAGDAGTALGAAQYVYHQILGRPRSFVLDHAYFGPEFGEPRLAAALRERFGFEGDPGPAGVVAGPATVRHYSDEAALVCDTAEALAAGRIVGWYQGRGEWGPRALGNRSILADPRRPEIKDALNARIKRREAFRPFAPSILAERARDFFEGVAADPFMIAVRRIRPEKRSLIPAALHVDGTARLQSVSRAQNPRFWSLLRAFEERTGLPVLLNTSFNENEPIVNTPEEALDCFLRTRMDRLVLGDWAVERTGA